MVVPADAARNAPRTEAVEDLVPVDQAPAVDYSSMSAEQIRESLSEQFPDVDFMVDNWSQVPLRNFAEQWQTLNRDFDFLLSDFRPRVVGDLDKVFGQKMSPKMGGGVPSTRVDVVDGVRSVVVDVPDGVMRLGVRRSWLDPKTSKVVQAKARGELASDNISSVVSHEFGHLVGFQSKAGAAARNPGMNPNTAILKELSDVTEQFPSRYPVIGDSWTTLRGKARNELSTYSASNVDELLAEAFAEVVGSPTPRPFAQAIYDLMVGLAKEVTT